MTMQELSDEMRKQKARCDRYCGTWNREDRDCEIYGKYHCPPSKCRYFLATELLRRNKEIKEKMTEEEKQRGLELQGYSDSIRDMTIKEIAIKHLKKHLLSMFLAGLLVKFSHPLLLAKDYELDELKKESLYYKDIVENNTAEWEEQGQRIVVLEKENAELKDYRLTTLAKQQTENQKYTVNLEHKLSWYDDQLTKAKELLEKLLLVSCNSEVLNQYPNCSKVLQARVEAEQFLNSEVAK